MVDRLGQVQDQIWASGREARLAAIEARIKTDLALIGEPLEKSTRGGRIPIVCLTAFDITGRQVRFRSTTEAAQFAGMLRPEFRELRPDHIRRAIVRNGYAGGHAWAWLNGRKPTDRDRQREKKRR